MLGNRNTNTVYLQIINGKFTRKVKEGTPGAVSRENKNKVVVWELQYDFLSGFLNGIETRVTDFGKEFIITLQDEDDTYILQIPFGGRLSGGICSRLPNIDPSLEVTLNTGVMEEKPWLTVSQNGKKVERYWTKENPGDLPKLTQVKVKGELKWDDSDQMEYYERYIKEKFIPKMKEVFPSQPTATAPQSQTSVNPPETESDLPFVFTIPVAIGFLLSSISMFC